MNHQIGSVLFCCDHNSVRSPMAEGLAKARLGKAIYIQSAGVKDEREIDGFSVAVCAELGVELARHRVRSFEGLSHTGDALESFDLIICLSDASYKLASLITKSASTSVEYWMIPDPTSKGETREEKLAAYRQIRDQLHMLISERFLD